MSGIVERLVARDIATLHVVERRDGRQAYLTAIAGSIIDGVVTAVGARFEGGKAMGVMLADEMLKELEADQSPDVQAMAAGIRNCLTARRITPEKSEH